MPSKPDKDTAARASDARRSSLGFLLRIAIVGFIAAAAGVYLVDYQALDRPPPDSDSRSASELPVVTPPGSAVDRARERLGLSRSDDTVEGFAIAPPNTRNYLTVPAASIRIHFCSTVPRRTECRPHASGLAFRLDRLVHFDRGGGPDSWDFVFVPAQPQPGLLRFVYRSNTGGSFGYSDDWGFTLGDPGEIVELEISNRIARVRGFGDSALAEQLDVAADSEAAFWWGNLPGGFLQFKSGTGERIGPITATRTADEIWSAVGKAAQWFAILAVLVGFLASLVSLSDAGSSLFSWVGRAHRGIAVMIGLLLGTTMATVYLIVTMGEIDELASRSADASLRRTLYGSLAGLPERAAREGVDVTGLAAVRTEIPPTSTIALARAAPSIVRGGLGDDHFEVTGPLIVRAGTPGGRRWNLELTTSVAVRIYEGPTAVPDTISISGVRAYRGRSAAPIGVER